MRARRTRSPPRSILDVCEQAGYRSATQQLPLKTDFATLGKKKRRWVVLAVRPIGVFFVSGSKRCLKEF